MEKYLLEDWTALETELLRERGLWGPPVGSDLDKWQLDNTEGPLRTRKRMIRNEMFYIHYPYRPDLEDVSEGFIAVYTNRSWSHNTLMSDCDIWFRIFYIVASRDS